MGGVHIRCCGNGCLGFRPDGRLPLANAPKEAEVSPRRPAPRWGSAFLRSGIPPGTLPSGRLRFDLHAACSTASNGATRHSPDEHLHSASRRGGWIKIKAVGELTLGLMSGEGQEQMWVVLLFVGAGLPAMAACQPTNLLPAYSFPVGAGLAREGGLTADRSLAGVHIPCRSRACPRWRPDSRPISCRRTHSLWEPGLPAMAA